MNIVVLCKRAPQNRDLWLRPYGRFYNLPLNLVRSGHSVHLVLLNYRSGKEFEEHRDGITWHSVNLIPDPTRYYRYVKRLIRECDADWVLGFSDTYFGICAQMIGMRAGVKVHIDAYDNYESYVNWCFPLHWLWRLSLKGSTSISAAGPGLLHLMDRGRSRGSSEIIEMAADSQFAPGSKSLARELLGLPQNKQLVAYCGSLYRSRGIEELFNVMQRLSMSHRDILWVMSGRLQEGVELPKNCHYLGYVEDDKVVEVLRSADLVLCVNKPGSFGDYSYPVKIYEALSVGIPVVAFRTESIKYVMRNNSEGLVDFGDLDAMAEKIGQVLESPYSVIANSAGWEQEGELLSRCLHSWASDCETMESYRN